MKFRSFKLKCKPCIATRENQNLPSLKVWFSEMRISPMLTHGARIHLLQNIYFKLQ